MTIQPSIHSRSLALGQVWEDFNDTMEGRIERVVIPIHGNRTLKIGLQRSLMKISPVDDDEL